MFLITILLFSFKELPFAFSISCKTVLLGWIPLAFITSESLHHSFISENSFIRYSVPGWQHFSFNSLNMSFHSLWPEKFLLKIYLTLMGVPFSNFVWLSLCSCSSQTSLSWSFWSEFYLHFFRISYYSSINFLCWYHIYLIYHYPRFLILISVHLSKLPPLLDFASSRWQRKFLPVNAFGFLDVSAGNLLGQVETAIRIYFGVMQWFKHWGLWWGCPTDWEQLNRTASLIPCLREAVIWPSWLLGYSG